MSFMNILWLNIKEKRIESTKFFSLDLVCTTLLMSDKIYSRGCELWCFQGRETIESTNTISSLAGILGGTGSELILEPVSKPVLELVLKSIREEWVEWAGSVPNQVQ